MEEIAAQAGFSVEQVRPWPDDWLWFRNLYDCNRWGLEYATQEDIHFIANVFLKELTPERGYFYGWEFVVWKVAEAKITLPENKPLKPVKVISPLRKFLIRALGILGTSNFKRE